MSGNNLRVILSGTGTSVGVPMIGCDCEVCRSADPRDRRRRSGVILRHPDGPVAAIDASPDFREQMIEYRIDRLDALLITHEHADHVAGIDDVRPFNFIHRTVIPVHGSAECLGWMRRRFDYIWNAVQAGGGLPQIELRPEDPDRAFTAAGLRVSPLPVRHGLIGAWGFRIGDFAYVSDLSEIPPATMERMRGLGTLVIGAVQYDPHATHFHVDKALEHIQLLRPRQAYLTHVNHQIRHADLSPRLPQGVGIAYDGLAFDVAGGLED